jgi:phosphotransferase system HPr (HPr) family protein
LARVERDVKIPNKYGLHVIPARLFVELASQYVSRIDVSNGHLSVDARSIMSVMRLAGSQGTVLAIRADGDDAQAAVDALVELVAGGFGEMDDD